MKVISVIIPVFNSEKTIKRCIDSVLNQTYKSLEIIIIDDGSTDNSLSLCRNFAERDARIIVKSVKNGGPSSARNIGLGLAKGDYVAFCDADDWMRPDMMESLMHGLQDDNTQLVMCYYGTEIKSKTELIQLESQEALEMCIEDENIGGFLWNKLFDLSIIRSNSLRLDETIFHCEDLLFVTEYVVHIDKAVLIPKAYYCYEQNVDSLSHNNSSLKKYTNLNARLQICSLLKSFEMTTAERKAEIIMIRQAVYAGRQLMRNKKSTNVFSQENIRNIWKTIRFICRHYGLKRIFDENFSIGMKLKILLFAFNVRI